MQVETANMAARKATPELLRELVGNDERRGEFMILMDDADDERFVQVACDFEDVGGKDDGRFDLEYREGSGGALYHCTTRVGASDVERVFLEELAGRGEWRRDFTWEKQNVGGGIFTTPRLRDFPPWMRVVCIAGCVVGTVVLIGWLVCNLCTLAKMARNPGTPQADWMSGVFFTLVPAAMLVHGALHFARWMRTRGKERIPQEARVAAEGERLRRLLPNGLVFLAVWCAVWDSASIAGALSALIDAVRKYAEKGLDGKLFINAVALLVGVCMTVKLLWEIRKFLRPCYEVRLAGGIVKEGERARFDYRFNGDAKSVEHVVFATAAFATGDRSSTSGAPPGGVNDEKELSHPTEIAFGSVSLELPRVAPDCHATFRHYFRATVFFRRGPSVTSSYRIPL